MGLASAKYEELPLADALANTVSVDALGPPNAAIARDKWRTTVSIGAGLATVVLVCNVGLLIWASSLPHTDGVATAFEGSCEVTAKATIAGDLAINILSTLLLGASNSAAQLLSAPTRADVDRIHARGGWLDIGVSSVRNLWYLPRWRTILCALLLLSTAPLHLLYNSVIFSSRFAVDYQAALVTEGFLAADGWWDRTYAKNNMFADVDQLDRIQSSVGKLTRLDNNACLEAYATSMFETGWGNVLVVTSLNSTNSTLLNVYQHKAAATVNDLYWICHGTNAQQWTSDYSPKACDLETMLATSNDWTIPDLPGCPHFPHYTINTTYPYTPIDTSNVYNVVDGSTNCTDVYYLAPVEYCLAEAATPRCRINVSKRLLVAVILCNIVKIACMVATLCIQSFQPLANIGDCIASFLNKPDPATGGKGALEVGAVSSGVWRELDDKYTAFPWTRHKRRWLYAVARPQLYLTFILCIIIWTLGIVALDLSLKPRGSSLSTFNTSTNTNDLIPTTSGAGLVANVVLANTPQLIISFIYLFYNDVFTRMLSAHEYGQFASTRNTLRVSRPHGHQRSTYWLQLPYRYSVPIMASMTLLHWLVSRSIYLVQIRVFDVDGVEVPDRDIDACGFSPLAILLAIGVSALMVLVLLVIGRFRYLNPGIPPACACSVAISAASHPIKMEPDDVASLPLQYGVFGDDELGAGRDDGSIGFGSSQDQAYRRARRHVGFCSRQVGHLESGTVYR